MTAAIIGAMPTGIVSLHVELFPVVYDGVRMRVAEIPDTLRLLYLRVNP